MKTTWRSLRCRMPRTGKRVVCGTSDTMDSFAPTMRFIRVDLPTLARPARATNPQRNPFAISPAPGGAVIAGPSSIELTRPALRVRRPRPSPGQAAPLQGDTSGAHQERLLQTPHLAVVPVVIVTEQVQKSVRHQERHLFLQAP